LLVWRILRPRAADAIGDTVTTAFVSEDTVVSEPADPAHARNLDSG
jgi:hypothetical protein